MGLFRNQQIAQASRVSAEDCRRMAKVERGRGDHKMAAEDERQARAFDVKARRAERGH